MTGGKPNLAQRDIHRLIALIQSAYHEERLSATELAKKLSTSETRIYHDIQDLNALGVPIYFSNTGYNIIPSVSPLSREISVNESFILLLGLNLLHGQGVLPQDQKSRLAEKLWGCVPPSVYITDRLPCYSTESTLKNIVSPSVMQTLNQAVFLKKRIAMHYQSRTGCAPKLRELSPYTLVYKKATWYAIGHCHTQNEVRTFNVSRIHRLEKSPNPFHDDSHFDPENYLLYRWHIFGGKPYLVLVRFNKKVGSLILEKQISRGRVWKERNYVYMQTPVAGLEEFSWWIMQYGENAEVLQPRELRFMLAKRCATMTAMYSDTIYRRSRRVKPCPNTFP